MVVAWRTLCGILLVEREQGLTAMAPAALVAAASCSATPSRASLRLCHRLDPLTRSWLVVWSLCQLGTTPAPAAALGLAALPPALVLLPALLAGPACQASRPLVPLLKPLQRG